MIKMVFISDTSDSIFQAEAGTHAVLLSRGMYELLLTYLYSLLI